MNKAISQTNTMSLGQGRMFYLLALVVGISFFLYLFFIGQTVFKLVSEKNISVQNRNLSTDISQLELESLSLNDTISIDKAYQLGFVSAKSTQYVSEKGELSLR